MNCIGNMLTNLELKNALGDPVTWLPLRPAVTYIYTLPWLSVAERRPHPIAYSELNFLTRLTPCLMCTRKTVYIYAENLCLSKM
jgi:hypothetical protein